MSEAALDLDHGRARTPLGSLVADRVGFRRSGRMILEDVSLTARPGQALAVIGPSGSGKSSLLALFAGLEAPDGGTVRREPSDARIGLILQAYGLSSLLTAAENVEIALQPKVAAGTMTREQVRERARDALADVGLDEAADHLVEELSGGQQQRVAIARALVDDPQIVLADEFTAELDHDGKQRALEHVLAVADRGGIVVIATHDPDIAASCRHVVRLVDGRAEPHD